MHCWSARHELSWWRSTLTPSVSIISRASCGHARTHTPHAVHPWARIVIATVSGGAGVPGSSRRRPSCCRISSAATPRAASSPDASKGASDRGCTPNRDRREIDGRFMSNTGPLRRRRRRRRNDVGCGVATGPTTERTCCQLARRASTASGCCSQPHTSIRFTPHARSWAGSASAVSERQPLTLIPTASAGIDGTTEWPHANTAVSGRSTSCNQRSNARPGSTEASTDMRIRTRRGRQR